MPPREPLLENRDRRKRTTFHQWSKHWDRCILPYTLYEGGWAPDQQTVDDVIHWFHQMTGFRFVPYTGNNSIYNLTHESYVVILK